jgi:hypothetical protein
MRRRASFAVEGTAVRATEFGEPDRGLGSGKTKRVALAMLRGRLRSRPCRPLIPG